MHKLRLAMMTGDVISTAARAASSRRLHGEAELEDMLAALRKSVRMLKQEGEI